MQDDDRLVLGTQGGNQQTVRRLDGHRHLLAAVAVTGAQAAQESENSLAPSGVASTRMCATISPRSSITATSLSDSDQSIPHQSFDTRCEPPS
ncbi:hypothetical protein [Streptomyces sp. NPDC093589]|uniref:hypothetical protein n=1 Tax=Streptomyces sp. NPDC093589 TaxID=3366043 RepID=UPI0037F3BE4B